MKFFFDKNVAVVNCFFDWTFSSFVCESTKIRLHLENKLFQKLNLSKNFINTSCSPNPWTSRALDVHA